MKLTVVGSGTAAPEAERVCSSYFVAHDDTTVLLDCGPGAVHHLARFGLPWHRLDHLVITHFHNDHIGDIPMLLFALKWGRLERRKTPLSVWGPVGTRDLMRRLAAALGEHVSDPGFPLDIRELSPGGDVRLGELTLGCAKTPHTVESLAYRLEAREKPDGDGDADAVSGAAFRSLGYTGDTGPSEEVARFLTGVDVMIAECSLSDDSAIPSHLSPSSLAAMARVAAPGRLLVTHVYPWLDTRDVVRLVREAGWGGEVARAVDGLTLNP